MLAERKKLLRQGLSSSQSRPSDVLMTYREFERMTIKRHNCRCAFNARIVAYRFRPEYAEHIISIDEAIATDLLTCIFRIASTKQMHPLL